MVLAHGVDGLVNLDRCDRIYSTMYKQPGQEGVTWMKGWVRAKMGDDSVDLCEVAKQAKTDGELIDAWEEVNWRLDTFIKRLSDLIFKGNADKARYVVIDCANLHDTIKALWDSKH